jgi:hypothetical protein
MVDRNSHRMELNWQSEKTERIELQIQVKYTIIRLWKKILQQT